ncbi:MAG: MATE family efflux transporter, partial [Lachnospiraceae bacterium]|nr:MATE family efflux transporter [Lachnospiraceae bacterium]
MVCKVKETSVERKFIKYVSQNIVGMIGISAYILADTFFISQAEGARGITALNLVLPLY